MLDFWFGYQREPIYMIEVELIVMSYVVIEHVNKCNNWSCSVTYLIIT